jgi:hypothetical protein
MRLRLVVLVLLAVVGLHDTARTKAIAAGLQNPRPLTVATTIELKLPLPTPVGSIWQVIHMAPDGTHFLAVFYQGDVARNGNWVTLAYGSTASLAAATHLDDSFRLFTTANVQPYEWIKGLDWLDAHERVAFLWNDGQKPAQVVVANLRTHTVQPITQSSTGITNFAYSQSADILVYATGGKSERDAAASARMRQYQAEGFAVTDQSLGSLLKGNFDGWWPAQDSRVFILSRSDGAGREVSQPGRPWQADGPQNMRFSPDGKYCLFDHLIPELPEEWTAYTDPWLRRRVSEVQKNFKNNGSLYQPFLLEIATGKVRPLWNAPLNNSHIALWSDKRHVVIGPAFLPVERSDADGLKGIGLAEVDVETGGYVSLPLSRQAREAMAASGNFGFAPRAVRADGIVEFGAGSHGQGRSEEKLHNRCLV